MSDNKRRLTYLSDIDGLRAIAVLAVVLFHLKIAGFDGGYVGVDIFFVISGFLISGLIRDRVETGNFSFSDFYARRVSRLLPAVLATVGVTAIASFSITAGRTRLVCPLSSSVGIECCKFYLLL